MEKNPEEMFDMLISTINHLTYNVELRHDNLKRNMTIPCSTLLVCLFKEAPHLQV